MAVTLEKAPGSVPVRECRLDLGRSTVLVNTRVVEYEDGTVATVSLRRPLHANVWTGERRVAVSWGRVPFDRVLSDVRRHERNYSTGERLADARAVAR